MRRAAALLAVSLLVIVPYSSAATVDVQMITNTFSPQTQTIAVGDSIRWVNADGVVHSAESLSETPRFDTGNIGAGGTATVPFPTKGSYPYRCPFHLAMLGRIQVGPNTAPDVNVSLVDGQTVSGVVTITGNVTDREGPDTWVRVVAAGVQLTPSNFGLGRETAAADFSYSITWDTRTVPDGATVVHILGLDGLATTTVELDVLVDNPDDADLVVSPLTHSGVVPKMIHATIRNVGRATAPASEVEFAYYDAQGTRHAFALLPAPALTPGQSTIVTATWDTVGKVGTFTVEAVADKNGAVPELLETNNVRSIAVSSLTPASPIDVFDL